MDHYECDCCGACCQGHLIVEAYQLDALRERRLVAADASNWHAGKSHDDLLAALADEGRCLVLAAGADHPCTFLGSDKLCQIYPTRPNACVAMQAGDEQCQQARAAAGLSLLLPAATA